MAPIPSYDYSTELDERAVEELWEAEVSATAARVASHASRLAESDWGRVRATAAHLVSRIHRMTSSQRKDNLVNVNAQ